MANDFEMFAGDTRQLVVAVTDENNNAVNMLGGSVLWKLAMTNWKTDPTSAIKITKDSANVSEITLANGSFTVFLGAVDTEALEGSYYHEAQMTLSDGTIATMTGKAKIKPNLIE